MIPFDLFQRAAVRFADRIALEAPDGSAMRFSELAARTDALAAAIQDRIPAGSGRIGLCASNSTDHVLALLAILASGRAWVPLNPRNGKGELEAVLTLARPDAILCADDCRDRLPDWDEGPVIRVSAAPDGPAGPSIDEWMESHSGRRPARPLPDLSDVQAVKFTSGSSGKPKGVLQSYRCWNTHAVSIAHAFGFTAEDRFLAAAPITHGTSCFLLPVLSAGGAIVIPERPKPGPLLEAFAERGVTGSYMTPTMIYNLLAEPGAADRAYPAMRHLIYSGAPMRVEQIRETLAVFPGALETSYGQAEAPQIISYLRGSEMADPAAQGSVGQPGPLTRIGILGPDRAEVAPGEVGEIAVRGDLLSSGYIGNPEAQAETFVDGWLLTGDLGRFDETGRLWIEGRKKEVIISGGFNVYPGEVENALGGHPAVLECTVFGIEDPKWGESVQAAVQLREGATADEAEIIAFVKKTLDSVKAPKRIHFLDDLPRNAVGKVMRREAKALIRERAS